MGIVSTAFVIILAVCAVFGTLLGMLRGLNRAALRFGLVVLSLVISLLIYAPITKAMLGFNLGGFTVEGYVNELFANMGSVPESFLGLVFSLVQILIGIIIFVLVFLALGFLTWLIAFPILKIFVRREKKKNLLLGALIGLVQGILVAVIICAPISGLLVESEKIANIEIDGNTLIDLPEEIGVTEYTDSAVMKLLDTTGGWVFDIVSTTTDSEGRKVSITSVCNTATTLMSVTDDITNAYSSLDSLANSEGEMNTDTLKDVGNAFISVGDAIEGLDEDSKELVNDLIDDVKDIASSALGELPPELETMIDSIDVEQIKIKSAGEALNAIVKYVEEGYANGGTPPEITQADVEDIVNGIADNMFLLDVLGDDITLIEIDDLNADKFKSTIENANLTQEEIDVLLGVFGLN